MYTVINDGSETFKKIPGRGPLTIVKHVGVCPAVGANWCQQTLIT